MDIIDVVIIGAGPSGLTASIYCARAGHKVLVLDGGRIGGQVSLSSTIENFPSVKSISGPDLAFSMYEHAMSLGVDISYENVTSIIDKNDSFEISTQNRTYLARKVILSMGAKARKLGVDGEDRLTGCGVCYCAICDGRLYKGKDVVVVGGGDSAVEDALYLSTIAKTVTIVVRKEAFRCQTSLLNQINKLLDTNSNVKVLFKTQISQIQGKEKVSGVLLDNGEVVPCDGVFVTIGRIPDTDIVKDLVKCDNYGYIVTDEQMHTSYKNIFACGDIRQKEVRQIITACGDGAIAGTFASK